MKDKVLAQLAASSSQLPLAVNDAVLSYVNYFTSERGRRVLYAGLKRSGRYQPMISRTTIHAGANQKSAARLLRRAEQFINVALAVAERHEDAARADARRRATQHDNP